MAEILAGEVQQGQLGAHEVVVKYEHRMAAAKAERSRQDFESFHTTTTMEAVEIKSDATNEKAIEKSKVHVAFIACSAGTVPVAEAALNLDVEARHISTLKTAADLQTVVDGNSAETYRFHMKDAKQGNHAFYRKHFSLGLVVLRFHSVPFSGYLGASWGYRGPPTSGYLNYDT